MAKLSERMMCVIPLQDSVWIDIDDSGEILITQNSLALGTQKIRIWPEWADEIVNAIRFAVQNARANRNA